MAEYKFSVEDDDCDEDFEAFFNEFILFDQDYWQDNHTDNVYMMHAELTGLASGLAKSQSFFAKTVGLNVHFDVFPEYMEDDESPLLIKAKVVAHLILPRYQCAMNGMLFSSPTLQFLCWCRRPDHNLAVQPIARRVFSTAEDYVEPKSADQRSSTGAAGPNEAIFSLAGEIDHRLFMPLSHGEKTLFVDTLRMLNLKVATQHRQQDLSFNSAPGVSRAQETSTQEVPKEQRSRQNSKDTGKEWPALMLLGSGILDAYPTFE